jgi:hypothetical protein
MSDTAKLQLREHLSSLLVPSISQGFWSVKETAESLCNRNKQPDEVLRTFQNMVTKIPEWSEKTLTEEVERIIKVSKCSYIDDLLFGVFLAYMKVFASLQYRGSSSQIKVEFERPNVSKFIHELYKQSARKLWQSAFLFKTLQVSTEQQARNRQEIEQIIHKCIDDVIRSFLPWDVIAKSYFVEPSEEIHSPSTKSVIFEDVPESESDSESENEHESEDEVVLPSLKLTDEDEKISVTDLNEEEQHVEVPIVEEQKDPLDEITEKIEGDTLVLNL